MSRILVWLGGIAALGSACAAPPSPPLRAVSAGAAAAQAQRSTGVDRPTCGAPGGVSLEVLGSGGPIPDDARASSGYLIWVDGEAKVLVDAGGGTFVRFGESGASLRTIDAILLSHLHTDHSAALPSLVKGMFFAQRRPTPVVVAGPAAGGVYPGTRAFMRALFGPQGAYRYLGWALRPGEGAADLALWEAADPSGPARQPATVLDSDGLRIDAQSVTHGPVPALAFRVDVQGVGLVFGGDQGGNNPAFVTLARQADVLVMHHAVPEQTDAVAARLHARPSEIAEVAQAAGAVRLLLSHHMQRSLRDATAAVANIESRYDGTVIVATDHTCLRLR